MKITDLLTEKTIDIKVAASGKEDVIKAAVRLISKSGAIADVETYEKGVFKREEESTTGVGEGIAIPHCKSDAVKAPALAAMVIPEGVDYASIDGEPVNLLFLIAAPNSEDNVHLEVLSRLSQMLLDDEFKAKLLAAKSKKEFLAIIDAAESDKKEEEALEAANAALYPDVLAVTGCPTGIAHTFMAAQNLKDEAKKMGLTIKVETHGSAGVENVLTDDEIEHAKGIVVAADVAVDLDRFAGKRLVTVPVAQGIHNPGELIGKVIDPDTPVYKAGAERTSSAGSSEKESVGHQIYKHLMNGVSHMLPFVIGGGILIALAFLIDTIAGNAGSGDFGSVNPVAGWFKTIGGFAFNFMIWVLAGFIASSIAGRPGLAVGMVGGFIATTSVTVSDVTDPVTGAVIGQKAGGGFNLIYTIMGNNYPKDLSGVSAGFIGGIFAGFIAGFMVIGLMRLFKFLPKSLESLKPTLIVPVLGILGIGLAMWLLNAPLMYVSLGFTIMLKALNDSGMTWLLCLLLAGMMAVDMGGPVNKAAYVFGTMMLAEKTPTGYIIMAAVMAGGMVPPLGIALSAHLFPKKYSKAQRRDAYVNYIMGGAFITEGAIPFAAADPWRVILSSVAGSAVAGLLTALFGCQLLAPHGGVFVLATIQPSGWTILLYLLAIAVGTFVSALLLGILKKDLPDDVTEVGKWKGITFPWTKSK